MNKLDFITDDSTSKPKPSNEPQYFNIREGTLYCGDVQVLGVRNLRVTRSADNPGITEIEIEAISVDNTNRVKSISKNN